MIEWLIGTDQFRSRILFASLPNFRARRELIIRLGESYLPEEILPQFRRLMRRLKNLGTKRNKLAHCAILFDRTYVFRMIISIRTGLS